jgi:hypothetical protein
MDDITVVYRKIVFNPGNTGILPAWIPMRAENTT